jgi:hypothetical protein
VDHDLRVRVMVRVRVTVRIKVRIRVRVGVRVSVRVRVSGPSPWLDASYGALSMIVSQSLVQHTPLHWFEALIPALDLNGIGTMVSRVMSMLCSTRFPTIYLTTA